jgi:hypothetical protein
MSNHPYRNTKISPSGQLDIMAIRPVPAYADDVLYTIEPQYNNRPDLLAYDLYKDHSLWWIFAQRNLNVIEDPIYDIRSGVQIYIPAPERVKESLGA